MGKRVNKKRTTSQMSARTKAVNKKAKGMSRRVKRGTAGTANAKGGGVGNTSKSAYSGSGTRQPSKNPKYGGNKKGSSGNLTKPKKRK